MQVKFSSFLNLIEFKLNLESQRESGSDYMDAGTDYAMNGDDDTIILELEK